MMLDPEGCGLRLCAFSMHAELVQTPLAQAAQIPHFCPGGK